MLQLYVVPELEEFQPWIMFQQGGAPPHWVSHVRRFLGATFPNRWIGRDGPTPWPPWSPDITPLDFFLWGYVKDKVFSTPVPDITSLKTRITDDFATITDDMLENTWREIDYRLDVLRAAKGAHVEVYWCVVKKTCWITFWKKKCLYSTYGIFLVINVCNQGKTLCSPCNSFRNASTYCFYKAARYYQRTCLSVVKHRSSRDLCHPKFTEVPSDGSPYPQGS